MKTVVLCARKTKDSHCRPTLIDGSENNAPNLLALCCSFFECFRAVVL